MSARRRVLGRGPNASFSTSALNVSGTPSSFGNPAWASPFARNNASFRSTASHASTSSLSQQQQQQQQAQFTSSFASHAGSGNASFHGNSSGFRGFNSSMSMTMASRADANSSSFNINYSRHMPGTPMHVGSATAPTATPPYGSGSHANASFMSTGTDRSYTSPAAAAAAGSMGASATASPVTATAGGRSPWMSAMPTAARGQQQPMRCSTCVWGGETEECCCCLLMCVALSWYCGIFLLFCFLMVCSCFWFLQPLTARLHSSPPPSES